MNHSRNYRTHFQLCFGACGDEEGALVMLNVGASRYFCRYVRAAVATQGGFGANPRSRRCEIANYDCKSPVAFTAGISPPSVLSFPPSLRW